MTDQKHEETATTEGMPEVVVEHDPPPPHVQSTTSLEVEVLHLRERLHEMEETVHTFLTHQTSVGHDRITTWLAKVKTRLFSSPPTTPAKTETTPPTSPTAEGETESSESKTSN